MAHKLVSDVDRFHRSYVVLSNGCWQWQLVVDKDGYGLYRIGSRTDGSRRQVRSARWAYEQFKGPLAPGEVPDHLCRNPGCVNVDHMEAVTGRVNTQRGKRATATNCPNGHPYVGDNLIIVKATGRRRCRACSYRAIYDYGFRTNWSAQRAFKARKKLKVGV